MCSEDIDSINLIKANIKDAEEIYKMQIESFTPLLKKYCDFETSPANESIEQTINRFKDPLIDYYLIEKKEYGRIGAIRVVKEDEKRFRISIIFILKKYEGKGYCKKSISLLEKLYKCADTFVLNTIKEEKRLCHIYESLGYRLTGQVEKIKDGMTRIFYEKKIC